MLLSCIVWFQTNLYCIIAQGICTYLASGVPQRHRIVVWRICSGSSRVDSAQLINVVTNECISFKTKYHKNCKMPFFYIYMQVKLNRVMQWRCIFVEVYLPNAILNSTVLKLHTVYDQYVNSRQHLKSLNCFELFFWVFKLLLYLLTACMRPVFCNCAYNTIQLAHVLWIAFVLWIVFVHKVSALNIVWFTIRTETERQNNNSKIQNSNNHRHGYWVWQEREGDNGYQLLYLKMSTNFRFYL